MKEYTNENLKVFNADCMDIMKRYSDNYFNLAIVDPPYGLAKYRNGVGLGSGAETVYKKGKNDKGFTNQKKYKKKNWDDTAPTQDYFNELIRVSKDQIIWGGNYFTDKLPVSRGWIYWDKKITNKNNNLFSDGELAYTSFNKILKKFTYDWIGFGYVNNPDKEKKIHPVQKPVRLYKWLLENYGDKDFKILDTHLGSGSSAIASYYYRCKEFVGIELDKDYYNDTIKRIQKETAQIKLF